MAGKNWTDAEITEALAAERNRAQEQARQDYETYSPQPERTENVIPSPEKSDYIQDKEWYDTYFPTIGQKEQEKKEKKARNLDIAQRFTNAGVALANAIMVGAGSSHQKLEDVKPYDIDAWEERENLKRQKRGTIEAEHNKNYNTAFRLWQENNRKAQAYDDKILREWQKGRDAYVYRAGKQAEDARKIAIKSELDAWNKEQERLNKIQLKGMSKGSKGGGGRGGSGRTTYNAEDTETYYDDNGKKITKKRKYNIPRNGSGKKKLL